MSFESVLPADEEVHYLVQLLNRINPPDVPSHKFLLEIGISVMLLPKRDPPKFCNGTILWATVLRKTLSKPLYNPEVLGENWYSYREYSLYPLTTISNLSNCNFPFKVFLTMTIKVIEGNNHRFKGDCFSHGSTRTVPWCLPTGAWWI